MKCPQDLTVKQKERLDSGSVLSSPRSVLLLIRIAFLIVSVIYSGSMNSTQDSERAVGKIQVLDHPIFMEGVTGGVRTLKRGRIRE